MTTKTRTILAIVACAVLAICFTIYGVCRDHSDYYKRRKGNLTSADLSLYQTGRVFARYRLSLQSDSGLKVESNLLVPQKGFPSRRYPAVIVLAGLETGKHAVDYVRGIPDVIIAATDYPYTLRDLDTAGKVLAQMAPLRQAALDTVPSVMLLLDYLNRRPDVDMKKVVVVGFSMGAIFVPCVTVEDKRPDVAVMVFGGGDLREIIRRNVSRFSGGLESDLLSFLGGLLVRPIEPMRYADRISPVPLLMINGTKDQMIPRRCTEELYQKARDPKELVWLRARHLAPGETELTGEIIVILRKKLIEMKILEDALPQ